MRLSFCVHRGPCLLLLQHSILLRHLAGCSASTPLAAQSIRYPSAGAPRTADGTVDMSAATPRTADGKPDFSGIWTSDEVNPRQQKRPARMP